MRDSRTVVAANQLWLSRFSGFSRACLVAAVLWLGGAGVAFGFSGVIRYTGALGPVNAQRPLCICVFADPNLQVGAGCAVLNRNDARYNIGLGARDYYLVGFLDIHVNETLDPDEPYEIFSDRRSPPGDPVDGTSTRTDIDFIFGDENLGPEPTATATATATAPPTDTALPSATPSQTPTATDPLPTSTPLPTCAGPGAPGGGGDCNNNGQVAINELIVIVRIALGESSLEACASADTSGDGVVQIGEIIAAVRRSLTGC